MKIEIKKGKNYNSENPVVIVFSDEKNQLIFDKNLNSTEISKFLFNLLETNNQEKIEPIILKNIDENESENQFLIYVKDLFNEFIKSWNESCS